MPRVVDDLSKKTIAIQGIHACKCRCRGRLETESDRTLKNCVEPGTIGCAPISPPSREAYDNLATTVAWKMSCIMPLGRPWCLSMRIANNVLAHGASNSSTCGLTESFRVNETPSALTWFDTHKAAKPKVFGGTFESPCTFKTRIRFRWIWLGLTTSYFCCPAILYCSFQTHMTKSLRRVRWG